MGRMETGAAYEHNVLDIVEGHSSFWVWVVFIVNMIVILWRHIDMVLSSIKRYVVSG